MKPRLYPAERWRHAEPLRGYLIEVDVVSDKASGAPVVTGLHITRTDDRSLTPISLRDVNRLPLRTVMARARAGASVMFDARRQAGEGVDIDPGELFRRITRARVQRSRKRTKPATWRELLDDYEALVAVGDEHPNTTLARRAGIEPNTMHQRLYRARIQRDRQRKGK